MRWSFSVPQENLYLVSGGIKGVLSGKHYNRSWMVHESFAEAIDRLVCEAFLPEITEDLEHVVKRNMSE